MANAPALAAFMLRLGSDASLSQRYQSDPTGTLEAEPDLDEEDKTLLLKRDPALVRVALSGEARPLVLPPIIVVWVTNVEEQ